MISDVAALYVDPLGPYPKMVTEWYDEVRDARTYAGPWPVVAHPPCGPWGALRHMSRRPQDKDLAWDALAAVWEYGGVLEHPRGSKFWEAAELPRPGEPADEWGGWTLEVEQVRWGHPARKRTWLYIVGTTEVGEIPPPREPTHWISGGRGRVGKKAKTTPVPPGIKVCSAQQRRRTPVDFAVWLIEIARKCGKV